MTYQSNSEAIKWLSETYGGGEYITLQTALKANTPTKIDMVAYYEGKFIEITNFVMLGLNIGGKYYPLNKMKTSEHLFYSSSP